MNWEAISGIAELIGGTALIVTLFYLSFHKTDIFHSARIHGERRHIVPIFAVKIQDKPSYIISIFSLL